MRENNKYVHHFSLELLWQKTTSENNIEIGCVDIKVN